MKVKRLLGSLAVAGMLSALSVGWAIPAFAAPHIQFSFTPSDQAEVPGSLDPHSVPVQVTAQSDCQLLCSMASLSFTIKDQDGNQVASGSAPANTSGSSVSVSINWDTQPASKKNGIYSFVATAAEGGIGAPPAESQAASLRVNNTPATPGSVNVTLDSTGTPVITWSANSEPDLKGYQVFRSDGAKPSGLITATSFRDASAAKGQSYAYKVAALRYSPVDPSGMISSNTSVQTASVSVPAPAAAPAVPANVATVDPPKPVKAPAGSGGTAPASVSKQPVILGVSQPVPITGPTLPTQIIQLPQPNVVQFAPLLPYSGKIPEVATTTTAQAPVQAQDPGQPAVVALPGGVKVNTVDAIKYIATAAFLIVAAVHITRFARKLKNAPV